MAQVARVGSLFDAANSLTTVGLSVGALAGGGWALPTASSPRRSHSED